jgi:hypothetical protein
MTLYTLLDIYKCFKGICWLHLQSRRVSQVPVKHWYFIANCVTSQKTTVLIIVTAVRTSDLIMYFIYIVCELHISVINFNLVLYQIFGSLNGKHILREPGLRKNYYKNCIHFWHSSELVFYIENQTVIGYKSYFIHNQVSVANSYIV